MNYFNAITLPHLLEINTPSDPFYYFIDLDTRSHMVNMEFQHFHSFYEIFIALEEGVTHIIEGELYSLAPFDLVALKPLKLHKTNYPSGLPQKRIVLQFNFDCPHPYLEDTFNLLMGLFSNPIPIYRFAESEQKELALLIQYIILLKNDTNPMKFLIIYEKFIELLLVIYKLSKNNLYTTTPIEDSITHKVYLITSFIHNEYSNLLSLEYIAEKFYISHYYLSHQFKRITGFTLTNYIQMTRIKNAQQMLVSTDLKITDICEHCGFTSFSQFNRVFNKLSGMSPSKYRQQNIV